MSSLTVSQILFFIPTHSPLAYGLAHSRTLVGESRGLNCSWFSDPPLILYREDLNSSEPPGVIFFPKLVDSRSPFLRMSSNWSPRAGQPTAPSPRPVQSRQRQSQANLSTQSQTHWPQWAMQLSPKAAALTVKCVCLQGSDAALFGEWEQGGMWRGVCN